MQRALQPGVVTAARRLHLDRIAAEAIEAFHAAGMRPTVLKGPSFATWLYPEGGRSYTDLDLLLAESDWPIAVGVLTRLGYRDLLAGAAASERAPHADPWLRDDGGAIELHRSFVGVGATPGAFHTAMTAATEPVPVGSTVADAPDEGARLLLAVLHAAQHGAEVHDLRPGDAGSFVLEDLRRALAQAGADSRRRAAALAVELEATAAFVAGLRLVPGGGELARDLGVTSPPSIEVSLRATSGAPGALALDRVLRTTGLQNRALLVGRELFPTPARLRAISSLARRSATGLVAAYVGRLLSVPVRLPLAVAAVWRARRQADGPPQPEPHQDGNERL